MMQDNKVHTEIILEEPPKDTSELISGYKNFCKKIDQLECELENETKTIIVFHAEKNFLAERFCHPRVLSDSRSEEDNSSFRFVHVIITEKEWSDKYCGYKTDHLIKLTTLPTAIRYNRETLEMVRIEGARCMNVTHMKNLFK